MLDGTAIAGLPGLSGLVKEFGSNWERMQKLFGGHQQQAPSTTPAIQQPSTGSTESSVAPNPQGLDAPIVDQHQFNHWNKGNLCGLATMVMMLRANGKEAGTSTAELNDYASQMYIPGNGTSGSHMAEYLRGQGLKDSSFTLSGTTTRLVQSLQEGQAVPFGVVLTDGEVTKLEGGQSQRYPGRRVGDRHYRKFGGSGHWILVTRFEGKPEKPTAFYVNDPDLGGELRCTPGELEAMGDGSGDFWMVEQR